MLLSVILTSTLALPVNAETPVAMLFAPERSFNCGTKLDSDSIFEIG